MLEFLGLAYMYSMRRYPETHTKRKATQHGCLPSLLSDEDRGTEIVYDEEKNILHWAD